MRRPLILAFLVLLVDQGSKLWLLREFDLPGRGDVALLPFLSLTMVWNRGVSWGMMQADGDAMRWLLVAVTATISVMVVLWLRSAATRLSRLGLALVLGGAIGNIIDRVRFGAVVDFVRLHVGDYSFYVFNIADAAISAGVMLLLAEAVLAKKSGPADNQHNESTGLK